MSQPDVIVIGAGVVGLSSALALQARGLQVTVLDRKVRRAGAFGRECQLFCVFGNHAAGLAFDTAAPKWLLDPLGPLSVPPSYARENRAMDGAVAMASMPHRVRHSTEAQTSIIDLARAEELEPFLAANGHSNLLRKYGNLQVYESEKEFRSTQATWDARERMDGLPPPDPRGNGRPATGSGAAFHQRHLHAVLLVDFRPQGLHAGAGAAPNAAALAVAEVAGLRTHGDMVEVTPDLRAPQVVLAAGAFSHRIARSLGDKIPLETERGYNTTLPADAVDLRVQITFGGHGFMVTKLDNNIRVGGAVELGGLDAPPNYKRPRRCWPRPKPSCLT